MYVKKIEKQIKEVDVVVENYSLCDKCNVRIGSIGFDVSEFDLTYKTGISYPEFGHGKKKEMELCGKCADDCIKLLKEKGYRINESEWEY